MSAYEEEEYEVPLRDQRYFGSGLKRQRVQFVRPTDGDATLRPSGDGIKADSSAGNAYLDIVLKGRAATKTKVTTEAATSDKGAIIATEHDAMDTTCPVCRLPLNEADHESRLAHQVCLPHVHPPSALDRQRKGLNILESQGWDPDRRLGLGAAGEGRLHPVRATEKADRYGVGHDVKDIFGKRVRASKKPVQKLDAGKVRKLNAEARRQDARMRDLFYRDDDVEKYLGNG